MYLNLRKFWYNCMAAIFIVINLEWPKLLLFLRFFLFFSSRTLTTTSPFCCILRLLSLSFFSKFFLFLYCHALTTTCCCKVFSIQFWFHPRGMFLCVKIHVQVLIVLMLPQFCILICLKTVVWIQTYMLCEIWFLYIQNMSMAKVHSLPTTVHRSVSLLTS